MANGTTRKGRPAARTTAHASARATAERSPGGQPGVDESAKVVPEAADGEPMLRKKDLVARVVEVLGGKKKDTKPVVEAVLSVLGEALSRGETLNLAPLGKVTVTRRKEQEGGEVLTARIRRSPAGAARDGAGAAGKGPGKGSGKAGGKGKTPLADAAETG